ncbi:MAG: hypothetical protein KDC98_11445, partial [Planctomycetes bacterium]|nr:hypothetical protein [Planctomycetota bacterium]
MKTAICTIAICSALSAQGPRLPAPTAAELGAIALPLGIDEPGDGSIYAAGARYKASFGNDGATFIPFFGSDAPRNYPIHFRVAAATVGSAALAIGHTDPIRDGEEIRFEHRDFDELYRVSRDGIEQLFRFEQLEQRGEIRLRIAADGELAADSVADGIRFANRHGAVEYGVAKAIDGRGRELMLDTSFVDGAIQLTVPGSFVAAATMPLWIDPLISTTQTAHNSTYQVLNTDIAFDNSPGEHVLSWSYVYSATDTDARILRFDAAMTPIGSSQIIDITSSRWMNARVANLNQPSKFLIVGSLQNSGSTWAAGRIASASANGTPGAITAAFDIENPSSPFSPLYEVHDVDVGGDASLSAPTYWTVVFRGVTAIDSVYCRQVRSDGTLVSSVPTQLSIGPGCQNPCISKCNGVNQSSTQVWGVAWYQAAMLMTATIGWNGSILGAALAHGPAYGGFDISSPTDHHNGGRELLLTWEQPTAVGLDMHVRAKVLTHTNVPITSHIDVSLALPNGHTSGYQMRRPAVDCDGTRYALALEYVFPNQLTDIYVATLMRSGGSIAVHDYAPTATTVDFEQRPSVVAKRSGYGPDLDYTVAWVHDLTNNQHALEFNRYRGHANFNRFTTRSTGCGGLFATSSGETALGHSFDLTLANAGALCGWIAGAPLSLPVPGCPGCTQGASSNVIRGSQLNVLVPTNATLVGVTLAFQG